MKSYCLPLLTLLLAGCGQHKQPTRPIKAYDYCYSSDNGVFLYSLADKQETRLRLNGSDPCLSPDGTLVAYTDNGAPGHEEGIVSIDRRIAIMDLADKKVTILDSNCHNCYGPVWSPDGNYLAYNAFTGSNWSIKCVDKDNRHPVVIARSDSIQQSFFAPAWSADSKKILLQDMSTVYMFDVNGAPVRSIPMQDIDTMLSVNSGSVFLLSPKEDKLIFENELVNDTSFQGSEPPSAIFVYDLNGRKLTRISPEGYDCFHPVLKGDTVFFGGIKNTAPKPVKLNIYSTDLSGSHFQLVFKNRQNLSYSLPGR